jgi:hypothetical protein
LWGEVNGVEVEVAKEGTRPHGVCWRKPGRCGGRRRVAGSVAVAAGGASTMQSPDGAWERLRRRRGTVEVELDGGDAQTRDVRPRARSLSKPHGAPKPPWPAGQTSEMRRPVQPITCRPNPQPRRLVQLSAAVAVALCDRTPALIRLLQGLVARFNGNCTRAEGVGKLALRLVVHVTKKLLAAAWAWSVRRQLNPK